MILILSFKLWYFQLLFSHFIQNNCCHKGVAGPCWPLKKNNKNMLWFFVERSWWRVLLGNEMAYLYLCSLFFFCFEINFASNVTETCTTHVYRMIALFILYYASPVRNWKMLQCFGLLITRWKCFIRQSCFHKAIIQKILESHPTKLGDCGQANSIFIFCYHLKWKMLSIFKKLT